jgi:hypothetical protein
MKTTSHYYIGIDMHKCYAPSFHRVVLPNWECMDFERISTL